MGIQETIIFEKKSIKISKSFRTIHYLGSKLRFLDFIKEVVDELDPDRNGVCDLFSGTGSISQHLSAERKIVSVDIQNYSNVICSALLNPISDEFIKLFLTRITDSDHIKKNLNVFLPLIEFEEALINGTLGSDLELVCNYLENSSLYSAILTENTNTSVLLKKAFKDVINNLNGFEQKTFISAKYFGGVYFSYRQAVILDAILDAISTTDLKYHNILLASLLSTASDIVNTVGKQFAQPIRPRNKNGLPKKGIIKQLRKDRNLDVLSLYKYWLDKYSSNSATFKNHKVLRTDYKEALLNLDNDVRIVYADPPYTRDHYSRFYHGLETLSLMDYPKISKTKIGGSERLSRGLYREEREQSDFCIRSKAPKAFDDLFKLVSEKGKILILSYSPYDKTKGAHPRVVEIELLKELAETYFKSVEIRSIGKFSHSKLNRTDLHLVADEAAELLIICKN